MNSRAFLEYEPLSGSSQNYRIRATGQIISRRQFLKRTIHCTLEHRATQRKAVGLTAPRKVRKDAGIPRKPMITTMARRHGQLTPLTVPVEIHSYPHLGVREVVYHGRVLGGYYTRGHGAKPWRCLVCRCALREEWLIAMHIYTCHRIEHVTVPVVRSAGSPAGGGRVLFTGDVRSHAHKGRMPWRVASDDPRYR